MTHRCYDCGASFGSRAAFEDHWPVCPCAWDTKRPAHRRNDPDTSKQSSLFARSEYSRSQAAAILRVIEARPGGADAHTIARILRTDNVRVSRRISDLRALGKVRDSGRRVTAENGRQVIVWELAA